MNNTDVSEFTIDSGFFDICIAMGRFDVSHLLLMNNAEIPWFLLIPETNEVELCDLAQTVHQKIFDEVRQMSFFVKNHFTVDKLNVACNGNVIRQMHLHVVGRRFDDYCWPGVVWGIDPPSVYDQAEIARISTLLANDDALNNAGYRDG